MLLAAYQSITGPTYPAKGKVEFAGSELDYSKPDNKKLEIE